MTEAASTLAYRPVGNKILGNGLMDWLATVTNGCSGCSKDALVDMHRFNHIFSKEVDQAIAKVRILSACKLASSHLEYKWCRLSAKCGLNYDGSCTRQRQ